MIDSHNESMMVKLMLAARNSAGLPRAGAGRASGFARLGPVR